MDSLNSKFWTEIKKNVFEHKVPGDVSYEDGYHDCSIPKWEMVRNAEINFEIEMFSKPAGYHAAVLFRKNGYNYLGVGLGGWDYHFTLFNYTQYGGFKFYPLGNRGSGDKIIEGTKYQFHLEFKGGFITSFKLNQIEQLLIPENFSLKDSLGSDLRKGAIGLYAYDRTQARIKLEVNPKPVRCFIITNIDKKTKKRRIDLKKLIRKKIGEKIKFHDSTFLTRERPLMQRIKNAIIESDFVIADHGFGEPRPNVYYETGIAHSIGMPVIHIGPNHENFNKIIPSDLRNQFFILAHELEKKLPETVKKILNLHNSSFNYL